MSHALTIEPHNPRWSVDFSTEAAAITQSLLPLEIRLHHIGSTAIAGIYAKPVIDIMGEVESLDALDKLSSALSGLGYEIMGELGIPGRRFFRKTSAAGIRTHHLHVFEFYSAHVTRHIAFRDYLRSHPEVAAEYSELKQQLVAACPGDMENYITGKNPFIEATEKDAVASVGHDFR